MPQHGDFSLLLIKIEETEPQPSPDVTIPDQNSIFTIQFQGEESLSIFRRSMKIHIIMVKMDQWDNENNKGLKTDP